jgi:hypothetical protein
MAFISLMAFAAVVGILAIAKYIETAKKNRLPPGISKLPGPKGKMIPIPVRLHVKSQQF